MTDSSNASRTNLMKLDSFEWDCEILEQLKIPLNSLPKISKSSNYTFGTIESISSLSGVQITCLIGD